MKMQKNASIRVIALLMALLMVLPLLPITISADETATVEPIYVLAGGDFQAGDWDANGDGTVTQHEASVKNVQMILEQIKNTGHYQTMNGFLFTGDYDGDTHGENINDTFDGMKALMNTVQEYYSNLDTTNSLLVQGNHDPATAQVNNSTAIAANTGFNVTGGYDYTGYSVYLINEDDYVESSGSESKLNTVATNLTAWLAERENDNVPIFVISHVQLAYSARTYNLGDGKYAKILFDVLNAAGAKGQNIIYLHGHNHSRGYDNYIGGEAIYLKKGDTIYLSKKGSQKEWYTDTLNFTYMNSGYVGYYAESGDSIQVNSYGETEYSRLTMSVFTIIGNTVKVERYNRYGLYQLKSAGRDGGENSRGDYRASTIGLPYNEEYNLKVYTSPQLITGSSSAITLYDEPTDITVSANTGTSLTVNTLSNEATIDNIERYVKYDITVTGFMQGDRATVSVPIPSGYSKALTRVYRVNGNTLENMHAVFNGNYAIFSTDHFSEYMVAELSAPTLEWEQVNVAGGTVHRYVLDTDGADSGAEYLIIAPSNDVALQESSTGQSVVINNNTIILSDGERNTLAWILNQPSGTTITGPSHTVQEYTSQTVSNTLASTNNYYYKVGDAYYPVTEATRTDTTVTTATQATVTFNDLISADATGWQRVGYYYKVDENTYYRMVAKRSYRSSQYTYTWGYSTTNNTRNVTTIGTETTTNRDATPNIIVYNAPQTTTTYSWNIVYTQNGTPVTVTSSEQSVTLYLIEDVSTTSYDAWTAQARNDSKYLVLNTGGTTLSFETAATNAYLAVLLNNGTYQLMRYRAGSSSRYTSDLRYTGSAWQSDYVRNTSGYTHTTDHYVRLFKYDPQTLEDEHYYLAQTGNDDYYFSTNRFATQNDLIEYLQNVITVYMSENDDHTDATPVEYTLTGSVTPTVSGDYTLTLAYGSRSWSIGVHLNDKTITDIAGDDNGTVYVRAKSIVRTGSYLTVTYDDDSTEEIPVVLNMVSGDFDLTQAGTYPNLTVSYGGYELTGYMLNVVVDPSLDPFPKSPDPGSVTVNKTATGVAFQNTGVAQVELSAKGIPMNKGVDVIVMLDTSSSMTSNNRSADLATALQNMLNTFKTPNSNGTVADVEVAIGTFNCFTYLPGISHGNTEDHIDGQTNNTGESKAKIYTGSIADTLVSSLGEDDFIEAFVNINTLSAADITTIYNTFNTTTKNASDGSGPYFSGTNYDSGFDTIYRLATAKQAENEANEEERDLYVIFMSDGATHQYNYTYSTNSSSASTGAWNNWLNGTYPVASLTNPTSSNTVHTHPYYYYPYYFNENYNASDTNHHFLAEAIKGDPNLDYPVILPDAPEEDWISGKEYMVNIKGLGATMYVIGFGITDDIEFKEDAIMSNLQSLPSKNEYGENLFFDVEQGDTSGLTAAFTVIAGEIRDAGTEAYFEDQMGIDYDLQMAQFETDANHTVFTPTIQVLEYNIYTRNDLLAGNATIAQVGSRKSGAPTVLETVTFNADGTEAYSSLIGGGTQNILNADGLIVAKHFVYNTNTSASKSVSFNGRTITVGPEKYYWYVDTIKEAEKVLRYYVYLTGSMEGSREAGVYPTNDHATLYYVNYAGAEVSQEAPIPVMPWESAVIYYAAYLVNQAGQPINAKGELVGFNDKVVVMRPSEGARVYLNNSGDVDASVAASALPTEYHAYEPDCAYTVTVNSGTLGGGWEITGINHADNTTYVTGFQPFDAYSNEAIVDDVNYSYTATTVWFAVTFNLGTINDVIVVDYGIPVDISVLHNDMFYEVGVLSAVKDTTGVTHGAALENGFTARYEKTFCSVAVNGNYVRYQLKDMHMNQSYTFSYAVNYEGDNDTVAADKGYYYGEVTVIPATIIYYEDSFVTFSESDWEIVGTTNFTATQAQDRPGTTSIPVIDANNVYGMDDAYSDYSTYSLGSAHKATVSEGENATASFSFTGTGFDIISLTDNTSGFITVIVEDENGVEERALVVNNYFETTDGIDCLYQIPVMKVSGLTYGQHTATITVAYNAFIDRDGENGGPDGETTFVLDSIRIYDPAGYDPEDSVVKDAYVADNEYKPVFQTVRNMLVSANKLSSDDKVTGVCFVETKPVVQEGETYQVGEEFVTAIATYANIGPNNECYLANGQGIAFTATFPAGQVASVQLGAKAPAGAGAQMSVTVVDGNDIEKTKVFDMDTATDLYYDLSGLVNQTNGGTYTFVISNMGTNLVSLTNFKTTTVWTEPEPAAPQMLNAFVAPRTVMLAKSTMTNLFAAPNVTEETTVDTPITVDTSTTAEEPTATEAVTAPATTAEEVTTEAEVITEAEVTTEAEVITEAEVTTEAEVITEAETTVEPEPKQIFTPKKVEVKLNKNRVVLGNKITVTVTASSDVKNVTVNGEQAQAGKTNKKTGETTWTYSYKTSEIGENEIVVMTYDDAGEESHPIVNTVTVEESVVTKIAKAIIRFICDIFKF